MNGPLRTWLGLPILAGLLLACNMPAETASPPPGENSAAAQLVSTPGAGAVGSGLDPATSAPTLPPLPSGNSSPSETPSPSPTPIPLMLPLTDGGCCTGISWAPDSSAVIYIDRPSPDSPAGYWRVGLDGGGPAFLTDQLGISSQDWVYRAFPQGDVTVIERRDDGARWTLSTGGNPVSFSPGSGHLSWTIGQSGPPFDTPVREIWVSNVDATEAREVFQGISASQVGWLSEEALLISGRTAPDDPFTTLWSLSLATGEQREILQAPGRLRGVILSPDRQWLAHYVTFSGDPAEDGIWVTDLESGSRRRLDIFGAYQWRSGGRLLVIPMEPGANAHRLVEVDAAIPASAGTADRPLTDPAVTPIRIAAGDWAVSPDGQHIAWVSAMDHNIWVLELPQ